ncbi:CRISPR-associated endonuclease Cas2 [Metamycoplasma equirhinis]|uniref:CRISPR-associated endoribonuclease Cas2 n=1 Tax=Metamycoplasma equirhinis TaxID=92402 RepID=A0ABZ0PB57_9BACT|nr:CRISPR-associated endonuclease Cas2 [Metamycoplasma equirhinis]WPB54178.1 CRISPR-associated endonuclease Cas2 [Metamycoplasma equirhinis]
MKFYQVLSLIETSNRYMRIIIMYDISTSDDDMIKEYNKFRHELLKLGYFMIQYSIYVKCLTAHTQYSYEKKKTFKVIPSNSNIRIMLITESQYQNIELLSGEKSLNEIFNNNERYIKF